MAADRANDTETCPGDPALVESLRHATSVPCLREGARWGDRFTLHRQLGGGGMSEVWSAWDERAHRAVAVKTAMPGDACDAALCAEALCLQRVRHPNLVALHGVSLRGEHAFLELELLEAQPVSERVHAKGPMALAAASRVIFEAGAALATLHRRDYAHRDVKPQNILYGFDGRAVLVDLGLALHRRAASRDHRPTLGTPAYMAPEVMLGEVDTFEGWCRVDQYALAVTAYHLYTGAFPFDGASASSRLYAQCCVPPTPASSWRRSIPACVDAVLSQALARHPEDRFGSVHEFLSLLSLAWEVGEHRADTDCASGVFVVDDITRPVRRRAVV